MTGEHYVLSRLNFASKKCKTSENSEDKILHWVEMDMLPLNRLRMESIHDPVLSRISDRIKRNMWNNCSMAEWPYKESQPKLTVEKGIICNGDIIIPPQSLRKEVLCTIMNIMV